MAVSGAEVLRQIQRQARASRQTDTPVTTGELVTRHALESFLDRLQRTPHGRNFVLKGGILLAGYGIRRPTKDVDSEAVSVPVTTVHIGQVVREVAVVQVDDGLELDMDSLDVQVIREAADCPGLRMRVHGTVGTARVVVARDISTGDPVVPRPRMVSIPRVLGESIELLGYAPETTVAEKGVTILGCSSAPPGHAPSCRGLGRRLRRGVAGQVDGMAPQRTPRKRVRGEPEPDQPNQSCIAVLTTA
jgi:hypothetical protein